MSSNDTSDSEEKVEAPDAGPEPDTDESAETDTTTVEQADTVVQEANAEEVEYNLRTDTRMERLVADGVAVLVVISLPIFIGLMLLASGSGGLSIGPLWMAIYSLIIVMSATRLYGKGVLSSAWTVVQNVSMNSRSSSRDDHDQ